MPPSLRTGLEPTKQQGNSGRTQQLALRASWDLGSRQWSSDSGRGHGYTFCTSFLPGESPLSPGYLVSDVIHHDDAVSTPVVAGRDGTEPLLPGRVPLQDSRAGMRWAWARGHPGTKGRSWGCDTHDLQLDGLAVQLDGADLEVHPDGADIAVGVRVILREGSCLRLSGRALGPGGHTLQFPEVPGFQHPDSPDPGAPSLGVPLPPSQLGSRCHSQRTAAAGRTCPRRSRQSEAA